MSSGDFFDDDVELRAFIRTVREVFRGEPWDQVKHYVERAWYQTGLAKQSSWEHVSARIRAAWE